MLDECEEALKNYMGYIVEIGAGNGENTIEFLKLAEKYDRRVLVIDPFEEGWGDMPRSYRYAYGEFNSGIEPYKHRLDLHRKNSLCETSEIICKTTKIAFAYVDGLQYKGAVLNDLRIVSHACVICVDDYDRENSESQVPQAVRLFMRNNKDRNLENKKRWALIK